MTGGRYAAKLLTRLVVCIALALLIVAALFAWGKSLGSDGAVAVIVVGFFSGIPPTVLLFILVVGPSLRRARVLGLPAIVGLIVPGLLACELAVFFAPVPIWPLALQAMARTLPPFTILTILTALWWSVARDPNDQSQVWSIRGPAGIAVLVGLGAIAVLGLAAFVPRLIALVMAGQQMFSAPPGQQAALPFVRFADLAQAFTLRVRPVGWIAAAIVAALILLEIIARSIPPAEADTGLPPDEDPPEAAPLDAAPTEPPPAPAKGGGLAPARRPAFGRRSQPARAIG